MMDSAVDGVHRGFRGSGRHDDPRLAAHLAAVATTLAWAEESATHGDYAAALAWLNVLDVIGEKLPDEYESKRVGWRRALAERHAQQHATESIPGCSDRDSPARVASRT